MIDLISSKRPKHGCVRLDAAFADTAAVNAAVEQRPWSRLHECYREETGFDLERE